MWAPKVKPLRNWRVEVEQLRLRRDVRVAVDAREKARAQSPLREFAAQHG